MAGSARRRRAGVSRGGGRWSAEPTTDSDRSTRSAGAEPVPPASARWWTSVPPSRSGGGRARQWPGPGRGHVGPAAVAALDQPFGGQPVVGGQHGAPAHTEAPGQCPLGGQALAGGQRAPLDGAGQGPGQPPVDRAGARGPVPEVVQQPARPPGRSRTGGRSDHFHEVDLFVMVHLSHRGFHDATPTGHDVRGPPLGRRPAGGLVGPPRPPAPDRAPGILSLAGGLPAPDTFPVARLAAAAARVLDPVGPTPPGRSSTAPPRGTGRCGRGSPGRAPRRPTMWSSPPAPSRRSTW